MDILLIYTFTQRKVKSQWPRGLRRRSTAARLLQSWVRIPPGAWVFVCCVLSGRGLCDELIIRPEESYRLWHVVVRVINKPREQGGHSPRWAAEIIIIIIIIIHFMVNNIAEHDSKNISWSGISPRSSFGCHKKS